MARTVAIAATLGALATVLVGSIVSARIASMQAGQNGIRVAMNAGAIQSDVAPDAAGGTSALRICFRTPNELSALYPARRCR